MNASERAFQEKLGVLCDVIGKDKAPNANAWAQALIEMLGSGIAVHARDESERSSMVKDACQDIADRAAYYAGKKASNVVWLEGKKR